MDELISYDQYFAHATILLGALGFLLQVIFNYKIKKKEILYTKLKESRIAECKQFIKVYNAFHWSLSSIYFKMQSSGLTEPATDREIIRSHFIQLEEQSMILKLFLKREEQDLVKQLNLLIGECRAEIFSYDRRIKRDAVISDEWDRTEVKITKTIPEIMEKITESIRADFQL